MIKINKNDYNIYTYIDMLDQIKCEFCNKNVIKRTLSRHQNSKKCRNKQLNKDIILPLKEYKCKYCDKSFNRLDNKIEHENNKSCNTNDIIIKLELKEKENEMLKNDINIYKEENIFLKNQLQTYKPNININHDNITNIVINNLNINFNDIQQHLHKFNIDIISNTDTFIKTLLNIFEGKIKLTNECKQVISYYQKDKLINDAKAKIFMCNSSNELYKTVEEICQEAMKKISISDTETKKANNLKRLLGDIKSEEGVKGSIRKKGYNEILIEIMRGLKDNGYVEINGV
tara:strand:+ start:1390 stop:2253 length:864 start_codon:yes stop_codon:yes gene_type:complete